MKSRKARRHSGGCIRQERRERGGGNRPGGTAANHWTTRHNKFVRTRPDFTIVTGTRGRRRRRAGIGGDLFGVVANLRRMNFDYHGCHPFLTDGDDHFRGTERIRGIILKLRTLQFSRTFVQVTDTQTGNIRPSRPGIVDGKFDPVGRQGLLCIDHDRRRFVQADCRFVFNICERYQGSL